MKITKSEVDKINYTTKDTFYWDTELKGFGIKTTAKSKTYIIQARINQRTIRKKIGNIGALTPEQARKQAQITLAEIAKGIDINVVAKKERQKSITLKEVYNDYKNTRKLGNKTIYDYDRAIETSFKDWKDTELIKIKRDMIEKKFKDISKQSEALANLHFRLLRALFNYAMEKYFIDDEPIVISNPVNRLKAFKLWHRIERKDTYIRPEQIKTFFNALTIDETDTPQLRQTKQQCMILLFTGAREQEVASLKRENIDFEYNTITFEETKNHHKHVLPLGEWLREYLFNLFVDAEPQNYIFPANNKSGHLKDHRKRVKDIAEKGSIDFTLHDLRRTFASIVNHNLGVGFTPYTIKRLLNHSQGDVTAGYIRFGVDDLRQPMQMIENFILTKAGLKQENKKENIVNFMEYKSS